MKSRMGSTSRAKPGQTDRLQWSLDVKSRMGMSHLTQAGCLKPASMEPRREVEDGAAGHVDALEEALGFNGAST